MPKGDTWPGGVAMESFSNMDSAGSCDSVISMNSGSSEDSMEHLSAEERASLLYLEEMIQAMEVQEDSGLSNDEPDPASQAEKMGHMRGNDISSLASDESGEDQKSFLSSGTYTPLTDFAAEPASTVLPVEIKPEHHTLTQTSEPQSNKKDLTAMDLINRNNPPAAVPAAGGTTPGRPAESDMGVIPPPSDFMDEPDSPLQPQKAKVSLPSAGTSSSKPGSTVDLEQLRRRATAKKTSVSSHVSEEPLSKPPSERPLSLSPPFIASGSLMSPPPEAAEPRSPPAVAPKPKKLPANIILKSHKSGAADGNSGHSAPTSSDRVILDPHRVRIEALRKLGLLKSNESDPGPVSSPKLPPKTRMSWAAPSPPVSPAGPYTPPVSPFSPRLSSPPPASAPLQPEPPAVLLPAATPTAPSIQPPVILPAPAAFSDPIEALSSDNELSAVKDVTEAAANTPPLTPPALVKQLSPPKVTGIRSASLERSVLGLSSYMAAQNSLETAQGVGGEQSPSQLRNSRPRPASMGSGKEFSSAQEEALEAGYANGGEHESRSSVGLG